MVISMLKDSSLSAMTRTADNPAPSVWTTIFSWLIASMIVRTSAGVGVGSNGVGVLKGLSVARLATDEDGSGSLTLEKIPGMTQQNVTRNVIRQPIKIRFFRADMMLLLFL